MMALPGVPLGSTGLAAPGHGFVQIGHVTRLQGLPRAHGGDQHLPQLCEDLAPRNAPVGPASHFAAGET